MRVDYRHVFPEAMKAMRGLEEAVHSGTLEAELLELVKIRASQVVALTLAIVAINGWNRLAVGLRSPVGSYERGPTV